jgi:hypothetical protein
MVAVDPEGGRQQEATRIGSTDARGVARTTSSVVSRAHVEQRSAT